MLAVFGLVETVRVDEQRAVLDGIDLFPLEHQARQHADGEVGLHLEEVSAVLSSANHGRVVACVAEGKMTGGQIHQAHEEGHKHIGLVLLSGEGIVHMAADIGRKQLLAGQSTEQTRDLGHKQGGRHTLSAHVSHAEVQGVVRKQITVQVSTYFLGRIHRGKHIQALAVREHAGQHRHLDAGGHVELTLQRCLLGRGGLELLDIVHQRLLHIAKRLAQLANLIHAAKVRQLRLELTGGYGFGLVGQSPQRLQFPRNDADEEEQHQEQAHRHNGQGRGAKAGETLEDITFRAFDGHTPAGNTQGLIEHIAVLAVEAKLRHAFLSALHGVSQRGEGRIGLLHGGREDGLLEEFVFVGVDKVSTALTHHDTVRVGIGLDGRNGLGQPVERKAGVKGSHVLTLAVDQGLAVGSHHLLMARGGIQLHVRLCPRGFIQELGHQVPVHIEILVGVRSSLRGAEGIRVVSGIGRKIPPVLLEIIGLKSNGAGSEIRIVDQHAPAV